MPARGGKRPRERKNFQKFGAPAGFRAPAARVYGGKMAGQARFPGVKSACMTWIFLDNRPLASRPRDRHAGSRKACIRRLAGLMSLAWLWLAGFSFANAPVSAAETLATPAIQIQSNLLYKTDGTISEYEKERCRLDLYWPAGRTGFASIVWFHGGALKEGTKDDAFNRRIAQRFAQAGVAVVMANYRLSPKAKYPAYIEDAAAAFAWTRVHIAEHGGDPAKVFVGGHSAGGYLTLMIGLDASYLKPYALAPSAIAGLIPVSGQTMTHYTVREERGLDKDVILADDAAPIHHVNKTAPPMLVLYAENDMPARAEENLYLVAALQAAGHQRVTQRQFAGRDHGSIAGQIPQAGDPVAEAILGFIARSP
jgi:acetyl esterase/lipase